MALEDSRMESRETRLLDRCRRQVMSLQEAEAFTAEVSALLDVVGECEDVARSVEKWSAEVVDLTGIFMALDRLVSAGGTDDR